MTPQTEQLVKTVLALARPMSKQELCDYFDIERRTLETYNMQGLPRIRVGKEVRYLLPDVLEWFRKRGYEHAEKFSYEAEGM